MKHQDIKFFLVIVAATVFFSFIPLPPIIDTAEAATPDSAITSMLDTAETFHVITQKSKAAVVYILVKKTQKENSAETKATNEFFNDPLVTHFFGEGNSKRDQSASDRQTTSVHGSGCLITPNGTILTNSHVVSDAEEIVVRLMDKREFTATIIGQDPKSDVALIKIDGTNLPVIPLGDSSLLKVGEWAIAIGSPFEMMQTVTVGIISATGRSSIGISEYEDFIQTDAAINPGNSGGPLLNIHGQVIGINTAFLTQAGGGYMGVGFAIPINMAKVIAERLQKDGKMSRAWLGTGLKDISPDVLKELNLSESASNGVLINTIEKGSPAAKAALHIGDIILTMNNIPITGAADLRNRIALSPPDTTITLDFLREGQKNSIEVQLGEKKDPSP